MTTENRVDREMDKNTMIENEKYAPAPDLIKRTGEVPRPEILASMTEEEYNAVGKSATRKLDLYMSVLLLSFMVHVLTLSTTVCPSSWPCTF